MEDQIIARIVMSTFTLDKLRKRVSALKSKLSSYFFGGATNLFLEMEEKDWLNTVGLSLIPMFKKEMFNEEFQKIDQYIEQIKPLTLYMAMEVDLRHIEEIGAWIRDNLSKDIMLDVKLDKELIGGCAFIWNGVYKDYSIRAKIIDSRPQITESFKQFLGVK